MTRIRTITRLLTTAVAIGSLSTLGLRVLGGDRSAWDRPAWLIALAATLVALALRIAAMAGAVRRGELPWPRLLLPAICWIEGAGLWWGHGAPVWQAIRLGTAIALETTFVVIAIRQLRRAPVRDEPPEDRIARPLIQLVPPGVARLIAFELVIIASALRFLAGGWRRPDPPGFAYHRESGLRMVLQLLPLIGIADVVLLEVVILPHAVLWLRIAVHVLAVYGLIWMIGLYASLRARPHRIAAGHAMLHRGLLGHLEIPLDQIAEIGEMPAFRDDWQARAYRKRAICVGVRGPAIVDLRLHAPLRAVGLLGPGRASDRVLVAVDDPAGFIAALGPTARPAAAA
jgi:hypothetical protein